MTRPRRGYTDGPFGQIHFQDTGGDGFTGFADLTGAAFSEGAVLGDGNDLVIGVLASNDVNGPITFDTGTMGFNTDDAPWNGSGLGLNQQVGLFWFPDSNSNQGSSVGFYRADTIEDGGVIGANSVWLTPASAGATNIVGSLTDDFGGSADQVALSPAALGTIGIPEPSSAMLLFTGLAGLLFRRRR